MNMMRKDTKIDDDDDDDDDCDEHVFLVSCSQIKHCHASS